MRMWGCSSVMCTCASPSSLLIYAPVRWSMHPNGSHTHPPKVWVPVCCTLYSQFVYSQFVSRSAKAHSCMLSSRGKCSRPHRGAGTVQKLSMPSLVLFASLSPPRSPAALKNFHISFMLLDKLTYLFLKLLCNSLVPTEQLPSFMSVTQLSA